MIEQLFLLPSFYTFVDNIIVKVYHGISWYTSMYFQSKFYLWNRKFYNIGINLVLELFKVCDVFSFL